MQIEIKKWGNSLAFRVPKDLANSLHLTEGQTLELELVDEGMLFKTKRRRSKLSLKDILSNLGPLEEQDWGEAAGQEKW